MRQSLIEGATMSLLTGLVSALGCASNAASCEAFGQVESAIKLESPDAGIGPVPASGAIVAVFVQTDDGPRFTCTATRIRDGAYVTARHCVPVSAAAEEGAANQAQLLIGVIEPLATSKCDERPVFVPVVRARTHTELDLAVLRTDEEPGAARSTVSMGLSTLAPARGESALIAGYGLTESGSRQFLRSLSAEVLAIEANEITVQGTGGGACVGDSGGPLFTMRETSEATLIGVLSKGSASCLGRDVYVAVAGVLDWVSMTLDEPSK